ncbi:MAG TPA: roadblock/LC7 domain-containing protein [Myxococcota bacterium]|nr:roadblock/LC7 domain-containing protein [Myxococcota bacterium]
MSFRSILQTIVDGCGGGLGAALMGNDGIPIEEVTASQGTLAMPRDDVGAAGVEFGRILEEIRKASDALGGGTLTETVVSLARFTLILRHIDDDTFLVLALAPDGNLGKARYLIRRHLLELREEL